MEPIMSMIGDVKNSTEALNSRITATGKKIKVLQDEKGENCQEITEGGKSSEYK